MSEDIKKAQAEAPAGKAKKEAAKDESYVYIGPNRLTDGLKCYTVYRSHPKEIVEGAEVKYEHRAPFCPSERACGGDG